jgi:hypothetical protein
LGTFFLFFSLTLSFSKIFEFLKRTGSGDLFYFTAAGVYLPEGRHPNIPICQHSIIPIAERSGAKFIV